MNKYIFRVRIERLAVAEPLQLQNRDVLKRG